MNRVSLTGRLTRDPETKYVGADNSTCVTNYSLAVDRDYVKNEEDTDVDFIRCVAFGKRGEFASKYFRKGMKIGIGGRIETGSYVDKDGRKVYTTNIVVDMQEFEERKSVNDALRAESDKQEENQAGEASPAEAVEDDLPFL